MRPLPSVGHSFVAHKRMVHLMGVFPSPFGAMVAVMLEPHPP